MFKCSDIRSALILPMKTSIVLYGAGVTASYCLDILRYARNDINIIGVVDDYKIGCLREFEIQRIEDLLDVEAVFAIVSPAFHFEIEQKLVLLNKKYIKLSLDDGTQNKKYLNETYLRYKAKIDSPHVCIDIKEQFPSLFEVGHMSVVNRLIINDFKGRGKIKIGNYSSLAKDVSMIISADHDYVGVTTYSLFEIENPNGKNRDFIDIGNDVWIGMEAMIMGGVKIGNGAVVGARAVVTKDVPSYAIVVGSPAEIVKYRFSNEVIAKLENSAWWNLKTEELEKYKPYLNDMNIFLNNFSQ